MAFKTWKDRQLSRPLGARKPRGDMKKTDVAIKDDLNYGKQRAEKADLLERMRTRVRARDASTK
ncbi:hypothetical protein ACWDBF_17050 [Streptomyces angustmyceticus]